MAFEVRRAEFEFWPRAGKEPGLEVVGQELVGRVLESSTTPSSLVTHRSSDAVKPPERPGPSWGLLWLAFNETDRCSILVFSLDAAVWWLRLQLSHHWRDGPWVII